MLRWALGLKVVRERGVEIVPNCNPHAAQVRVKPAVTSRVDSSVQVTDLESPQVPLPLPGPQPSPSTSRADAGVSTAAAAPRAAHTQPRYRTRAQVQRNSYELLRREVQQLTPERPAPSRSNIRIITDGLGGFYRAVAVDKAGAMASASSQPQQPPPATALQGPLAYDKPKGIAAVLLPILCVPTDALDMQVLFKTLGRAFLVLSSLLLQLSFLSIPAWLWLARHELLISHTGDAVGILLAGLLLFLGGGVAVSASAASASQRKGVIVAGKTTLPSIAAAPSSATSSSYPSATPPSTNGVAGAPHMNGTSPAPSADPPGASTARSAAPTPAAGPAPAPAASVAGAYPHQHEPHAQRAPTPTDQAVAAQSTDPMISQIKQRIIKLEKVRVACQCAFTWQHILVGNSALQVERLDSLPPSGRTYQCPELHSLLTIAPHASPGTRYKLHLPDVPAEPTYLHTQQAAGSPLPFSLSLRLPAGAVRQRAERGGHPPRRAAQPRGDAVHGAGRAVRRAGRLAAHNGGRAGQAAAGGGGGAGGGLGHPQSRGW